MMLLGRSREDLMILQLYSVAESFLKMLSRMDNCFVPESFGNCFRNLKGKVKFIERSPTKMESGRNHDQTFLLKIIPAVTEFAYTEMPNLKKMAEAAQADKDKHFKVYNRHM